MLGDLFGNEEEEAYGDTGQQSQKSNFYRSKS
jgi:hypothetical protein